MRRMDGALPTPPDEAFTLELLGRIQGGDREAWDEVWRRHHDQLLLTIRSRLGSGLRAHLESADVFQSVALDAFRAVDRFEYRGKGSLVHFLNKLVLNKIRDRADHFGAAKRAGGTALTDTMLAAVPAPGSGAPAAYLDPRYERLERAIAALPEDLREVLLLRRIEGLPSAEVAEMLGRTDAAIRKSLSRAVARLTLLLGEADQA